MHICLGICRDYVLYNNSAITAELARFVALLTLDESKPANTNCTKKYALFRATEPSIYKIETDYERAAISEFQVNSASCRLRISARYFHQYISNLFRM